MEHSSALTPIYTIGYGNRSIAELIELLHAHQIAYLIDVRSAPYSRYKPEFSKAPLAHTLEQHGIRYVFMGDTLGGRPDDETCYVNGKVDYERVKATEPYQRGIQRLRTAFSQQHSIVLMCSEGKPEECHRCKLIGATLMNENIAVMHIDETGEQLTQAQVIERLTGGQLSMFGSVPVGPKNRQIADTLSDIDTTDKPSEAEVLQKMREHLGIADIQLIPLEELRKRMARHGIRAEDNEFSRAIIEEREK